MPDHVHSADGPESCFGCKAKYWRENGGLQISYPYGQDQFHNSTVKESNDEMFRLAARDGIKPEPAGPSVWT